MKQKKFNSLTDSSSADSIMSAMLNTTDLWVKTRCLVCGHSHGQSLQ